MGRPTGRTEAHDDLFDEAFLRRLEGLRLRARRLTGAPGGGRPGRQRTPAADFTDHRPYSPGDDLRYVDWPALARHDQVHVKVGPMPQATAVQIVLDTSASMAWEPEKRRLARQLAAALGWLSLAAGDRLTLRPFPDLRRGWGPGSGPGAAGGFLSALAGLGDSDDGSPTRVQPALQTTMREAPVGGLAVVISDLWLKDDLDLGLSSLPPPRWDVLVLHLLGPSELDPRLDGALELEDVETGQTLSLVIDDDLKTAYRHALHRRLEQVRQVAGKHGASYAFIPAVWPLERAVVPYLRRRALLAA